jgi:hypothetical protein
MFDYEQEDNNDTEVYHDKKDISEYMRYIIRLESIFRTLRSPPTFIVPPQKLKPSKPSPWIVSMRVITPLLHPISQEQISVTTSNHTSSNESGDNEKVIANNTLSLLANLPSHMTMSGTQIQQTIQQSLFSGNLDKRMIPRLLFTCTNVNNELYEAELAYEDLINHRNQMAFDKLNWKTYLEQIHYGIFTYDTTTADEESVRVQYEDETRDLLKLTLLSPLTPSSPLKLKYEFELCAVRSQSQFLERIQSIVYDQTVYSTQLYRKRIQEDQKTIQQLEKELKETRSRLLASEDRLALFQSGNTNYSNAFGGSSNDVLDDITSKVNVTASNNNNNKNKLKRKAPMSLINPNQKKRKAGISGARIK